MDFVPRMCRLLSAVVLLVLIAAPSVRAGDKPVDLELVIAVDVSWSVDRVEAKLQRDGYIAAFTDPQVIEAIEAGFLGRIAVLYMEWAGMGHNRIVIDWTEIGDADGARAFVALLASRPFESGYRTSISEAIDFAVPQFEGNGFDGKRRVIDVSGDGANNYGRLVTKARDDAVTAGITINGLPILGDDANQSDRSWVPNLDLYFQNCVVGGRGSFVIAAENFTDFASAIRQKLVLEIADRRPVPATGSTRHAGGIPTGFRGLAMAADDGRPRFLTQVQGEERQAPPCDIGERRWMYRYGYGN